MTTTTTTTIDDASAVETETAQSNTNAENPSTAALPSTREKPKFVHAITQRVVTLAIDEFKQPETIQKVKDHILAPLVKLIYAQIYPYLIVGAIVMLCALVMWVLMFLMFTMAFFKNGRV